MLNQFRSMAGSFAAKLLLILLVLMFGVWGIGDMLRNPSQTRSVATVGSAKIGREAYMHALRQRSEAMRQLMGDRYSPEAMKAMNLPQQVLFQMVNQTLLKQESEALGLVPSDADVVRKIRSNPSFQDSKGNFDKTIFDAVLRNTGMSEKNYVDQMRQEMGAQLLRETLIAKVPVPDGAARALYDVRQETRGITLYTFGPSLVGEVPQPDATQVKAYYETHVHEFTAPEYRTVSYVTLASSDVHANADAVEDELKAAYTERIEEFKHPERRNVEQLLYGTKEAADKAKTMIAGGKNFVQVAKETEILNKDAISMGKIERGKLFEGAADTVFALKNDGVTDPIQTPFGWHIFHVTAIEPPSTDSFETVRPILEKDMKQRGNDEALNKLANKLEDALAGGNTLAEATHDLGLKIQSAGTFDHSGMTQEGGKDASLPAFDKFIDTAFKTDEKSDSQMLTSKGGIYYMVHVDKVTPEHLRPLDEVRPVVIAGWQKEEREKRLSDIAKDITAKFASDAGRAEAIAKYKIAAEGTPVIRRDSEKAGNVVLPARLVSDVFTHEVKASTEAYPLTSGGYAIAVVDSVIAAPAPDKDAALKGSLAEINSRLEDNVSSEILEQYTRHLAEKYPVSVDQAALQSIVIQ